MTQSKNDAYDGKGAAAGGPNPDPEYVTTEKLAEQAGVSLAAEEAVNTKSKLDKRDDARWELNPDSAQKEL